MTTQRLHPEGLLGRKLGMAQVFTTEGECVPVTVIELGPNYVLSVKSQDKDGYQAVQLGFQPKKAQRVNKALMGHFAKAAKGAFYHVDEVRCDVASLGWVEQGKELTVSDVFADGDMVDVTGVSIGRGFAGVVRRHHMKGQPSTRGTHEVRRHVGSIGCRKFPGRVHKGKRMPGHMGHERVTIQNLKVMGLKPESNVMLVRGGVPGAKGSLVLVKKAIKGYQTSKAA
jgi:large subunit ribosomal protein L3